MSSSHQHGSALRDSGLLATGSFVSGFAAYLFIAIGTRTVGSVAFAPVSVLWTIWAMSAAVFTFPVQHWVIRTIEADAGEGGVRTALPSFLAASVIAGALVGMVSWPLRSTLFGVDGFAFPLMAAVIPIGSVLMGINRGVLSARRRFKSTAFAIAGENLIRSLIAAAVGSATGLGLGILAGFFVGAFWPSSFKLNNNSSGEVQSVSPLAFVGGVAAGTLIGQIILTSGPLILAVIGGAPAEITGLFSALALFRAPYMIAIGVTPRVTAWLTRRIIDDGAAAMRAMTVYAVLGAVILAIVAGLLGWAVGPQILELVFGSGVSLPRVTTAIVAVGSAVAISTLFLTLLMVAAARAASITTAWMLASASGVVVLFAGVAPPVDLVAAAFLIAEVVALAAIATAAMRRRRR